MIRRSHAKKKIRILMGVKGLIIKPLDKGSYAQKITDSINKTNPKKMGERIQITNPLSQMIRL
jgi:hypothetical protein